MSILIVEDDRNIRETLVELLADEGYQIDEAGDGQEALTYLRDCESLPELILLDLTMPIMNGWEFRAEQRLDPRLSSIPVVVLSAYRHAQEQIATLDVETFLPKPIDADLLLKTIDRYATT